MPTEQYTLVNIKGKKSIVEVAPPPSVDDKRWFRREMAVVSASSGTKPARYALSARSTTTAIGVLGYLWRNE